MASVRIMSCRTCLCAGQHECLHVRMHVCMHVCMHSCVCVCVCVRARTGTHSSIHSRMRARIHTTYTPDASTPHCGTQTRSGCVPRPTRALHSPQPQSSRQNKSETAMRSRPHPAGRAHQWSLQPAPNTWAAFDSPEQELVGGARRRGTRPADTERPCVCPTGRLLPPVPTPQARRSGPATPTAQVSRKNKQSGTTTRTTPRATRAPVRRRWLLLRRRRRQRRRQNRS